MTITKLARSISIIFYLTFFFTAAAIAAEKDPPITISADEMMTKQKSNAVIFKGNVDARQGDLRIRSDQMTVYHNAGQKGKKQEKEMSQKVDRIVCEGNIEITRDDWLGTSKKMIYQADKKEVLLTGDARFWQGKNMVAGEKIIYYMDEGRSEVLGGGKTGSEGKKGKNRVEMTIIQ